MSLGLSAYHSSGNGGEFRSRIEYNSKAGRMFRVDRVQDAAGNYSNDKVDITMSQPEFAVDLGSIEVGWFYFPPGAAPVKQVVPYGKGMPTRPGAEFKAGFQVLIWNPNTLGAAAREFSSSAGATVAAMEELYDVFSGSAEGASGMIPVIKVTDHKPIQSKHGTNYRPVFEIVRWTERKPDVFGDRTVPPPSGSMTPAPAPAQAAPAPAPAPSAPPANHVPPPAAVAAAAMAPQAAAAMPDSW